MSVPPGEDSKEVFARWNWVRVLIGSSRVELEGVMFVLRRTKSFASLSHSKTWESSSSSQGSSSKHWTYKAAGAFCRTNWVNRVNGYR